MKGLFSLWSFSSNRPPSSSAENLPKWRQFHGPYARHLEFRDLPSSSHSVSEMGKTEREGGSVEEFFTFATLKCGWIPKRAIEFLGPGCVIMAVYKWVVNIANIRDMINYAAVMQFFTPLRISPKMIYLCTSIMQDSTKITLGQYLDHNKTIFRLFSCSAVVDQRII